jgi:hypothetical protein
MDWLIGALILAAIGGAIKLVKDRIEKKPQNKAIFFLEIAIICITLYFGIFARLIQKYNETEREAKLYEQLENSKKHTDTSISKSTTDIQDSASAREKRMDDTITKLQKAKIEDRKPRLDNTTGQ